MVLPFTFDPAFDADKDDRNSDRDSNSDTDPDAYDTNANDAHHTNANDNDAYDYDTNANNTNDTDTNANANTSDKDKDTNTNTDTDNDNDNAKYARAVATTVPAHATRVVGCGHSRLPLIQTSVANCSSNSEDVFGLVVVRKPGSKKGKSVSLFYYFICSITDAFFKSVKRLPVSPTSPCERLSKRRRNGDDDNDENRPPRGMIGAQHPCMRPKF
jgi:hypothetical protein